MTVEKLKKLIDESRHIVCLAGLELVNESGYPNYRNQRTAYDTELKYGYSPEELYTDVCFATRKELFFRYYRNEVLYDGEPGVSYRVLAKLEQMGKLKCTITRGIYDLPGRAGCKNVIYLHGCVNDNYCTRCRKKYPLEYVKNSPKTVPLCQDCGAVVRPGVLLLGEMMRNADITRAANEIEQADMLLVLGCNLKTFLSEKFIQYYKGNKLVLINEEEHFADVQADYRIHDKPMNILPLIV